MVHDDALAPQHDMDLPIWVSTLKRPDNLRRPKQLGDIRP